MKLYHFDELIAGLVLAPAGVFMGVIAWGYLGQGKDVDALCAGFIGGIGLVYAYKCIRGAFEP